MAKTTFWSGVAAVIYFPTSQMITLYLYHHKDPDIEQYIGENLEQVIKNQEKKIGISYPSERPKIEYAFPEDGIRLGYGGLYNVGEDTIYLPSGLLTKPRGDFNDFVATVFTFNNTFDAKRVLDHELAHFYCDKVLEQKLGKNYHLFHAPLFRSDEEYIARKLIDEGIARYVENVMNGEDKKAFPLDKWPSKIEDFSYDVIYNGGYAMVKPVIDEHKEKGILFLLFYPPVSEEIFQPKGYQERILTSIEKSL